MITLQESFLSVSTSLSAAFMGATEGLLGVFNGVPSDDFQLPNGTVLNIATEDEIYNQFGLHCELHDVLCVCVCVCMSECMCANCACVKVHLHDIVCVYITIHSVKVNHLLH